MQATSVFTAAAANRFSSCSALVPGTSLVAYGSARQLALWDPTAPAGVRDVLAGHQGEVTAVKPVDGRPAVVSGDSRGGVRLWDLDPRHQPGPHVGLQGHTKSISALANLELDDGTLLVLAGASDGTVITWSIGREPDATPKRVQTMELGSRLPLDAAFSRLPGGSAVLAIGTTSAKVSLYLLDQAAQLHLAVELPGHSDWIRCLDFWTPAPSDPPLVFLASGSQDSHIRLWRITRAAGSAEPAIHAGRSPGGTPVVDAALASDLLAALDASDDEQGQKVEMRRYPLGPSAVWTASAEAVLIGHESWVTNVRFLPPTSAHPGRLLSTSADRSMILWATEADPEAAGGDGEEGMWLSVARFGELAPSTNLSFFGGLHLPGGRPPGEMALASGWGGAWHVWTRSSTAEGEADVWEPRVAPTGHSGPVADVCWDAAGERLLTCSEDKTSRLWGPWRRAGAAETWHELGRPQVHGHPLSAAVFVGVGDRNTRFASCSEEKVVRAFDAPRSFFRAVAHWGFAPDALPQGSGQRAEAATVPPLELSNRAVADGNGWDGAADEGGAGDEGVVDAEVKAGLKHPPFEEQLLSSTLWPEVDKVYGHPSETLALAASADGSRIASSCHAAHRPAAAVRIHETATWRPVGAPLEWHALSVTGLAFCGRGGAERLVSVGRDRGWAVWRPAAQGGYELEQAMEKAHARIIFDVAWSPDGRRFATASRDKTVKVWTRQSSDADGGEGWAWCETLQCDAPATACAFAPATASINSWWLAVGLDTGAVAFYSKAPHDARFSLSGWLPSRLQHDGAVNRLAFCPCGTGALRLASGGEDRTVRVLDLRLPPPPDTTQQAKNHHQVV